jgi:hypothetical protein
MQMQPVPDKGSGGWIYLHRTNLDVPDEVRDKAYASNNDDHSNCANDKISHVSLLAISVTIFQALPSSDHTKIREG